MPGKAAMTAAVALLAAAVMPQPAQAFCGFYVSGSGAEMFNDATQVVLMRMGTRTVLSMQNDYKGPPEAFALVVPVPVVLQEPDVKTLTKDVFGRVEQMGAPRLVEYWEQDPCAPEPDYSRMMPASPTMSAAGGAPGAMADGTGVTVEAQFTVGEYQIVILSAKDSTGLDRWLRQEKYQIPAGAEPLLRPYVEAGLKFFVAKVDPQKVKFEDGRVALSPLRFHYDSDEFTLPIRLGLANSGGTQDLIVSILAPGQRYEVANYANATVPTNLDVKDEVRERFGEFYAALFDKTLEKNPGAVVTEYAWQATTCDPCPGPQLGMQDFSTLGADVLAGAKGQAQPYHSSDFVLTRLHARYGKDVTNDLVFKAAAGIVGGRESHGADGKLESGAAPSGMNNFQARYAIRHQWLGPIQCASPKRGRWGGPWPEVAQKPDFDGGGVKGATKLAFARRGAFQLASAVRSDVPELGLTAGAAAATPAAGSASAPPATQSGAPAAAAKKKSGCGCAAAGAGDAGLALVFLALLRRRRTGRAAKPHQ
ncbi:MAG: DUF2330 domain-containing protein [Myxococcales bacterium]|nr:DUF2330 domain-containing protein [Myxococcales bacterium]